MTACRCGQTVCVCGGAPDKHWHVVRVDSDGGSDGYCTTCGERVFTPGGKLPATNDLPSALPGVESRVAALEARVSALIGPRVHWYAAGGGLLRAGPYATQRSAWSSLTLTTTEQDRQGSPYPADARVWPEACPESCKCGARR
jgi:hypothetical protein